MTTSAFTVTIGSYELNQMNPAPGIDADGHFTSGRPNPTRITWSKENSIKTHEIPYPKFKTSKTAKETLWNLDLEFVILTKDDLVEIGNMIDKSGPYSVKTAFKSMMMYIKSGAVSSEAGYDDYRQICTLKLVEMND